MVEHRITLGETNGHAGSGEHLLNDRILAITEGYPSRPILLEAITLSGLSRVFDWEDGYKGPVVRVVRDEDVGFGTSGMAVFKPGPTLVYEIPVGKVPEGV